MARKRIETITNTKTGEFAKVYRDSEWQEYVVRFYDKAGALKRAEDFHTDDKGDAQTTARSVIWHQPAARATAAALVGELESLHAQLALLRAELAVEGGK